MRKYNRVRDYDNLEVQQYLDAVAAWLLIDDGGLFCDVHHTTELGETDCTRMIIMDTSKFPACGPGVSLQCIDFEAYERSVFLSPENS